MSEIQKRAQSLEDLPEKVHGPLILTPRSRLACDIEGIDASSLVYRPVEEFVDKQLSPRLVKLRYDFFEAKRKDMLVLVTGARLKVIEERRMASRETSSSSDWGILNIEREKLARFEAEERKWLENCLNREIHLLETLESEDTRLTAELNDSSEKQAQESRRIKELNDRRRVIEEQKQRVREAQQEIEKEEAKAAFAKRQAELDLIQKKMAEKKQKQHLKSVKDAENRILKESAKRQAQDDIWAKKLAALSSMEKEDLDRLRILNSCKKTISQQLHDRMSLKAKRVTKSIEKHKQMEKERKTMVLARFRADRERDHRLAVSRSDCAQETAKKSLHLMVKRQIIKDESERQLEVRRSDILAHQAEIETRLREHEQKREKYLSFKLELEALREENKRMNVDRQRKKFSFLRNTYAEKVEKKNSKIQIIFSERQKLWNTRKEIATKSQIVRDNVKSTIMDMRIKSKIQPAKVKSYVDMVLSRDQPHEESIVDSSEEELPQMIQSTPSEDHTIGTPEDPPEPAACTENLPAVSESEMSVPDEPICSPVSPIRYTRPPTLEFAVSGGHASDESVVQHSDVAVESAQAAVVASEKVEAEHSEETAIGPLLSELVDAVQPPEVMIEHSDVVELATEFAEKMSPVESAEVVAEASVAVLAVESSGVVLHVESSEVVLPVESSEAILSVESSEAILHVESSEVVLAVESSEAILPVESPEVVLPVESSEAILDAEASETVLASPSSKTVLGAESSETI